MNKIRTICFALLISFYSVSALSQNLNEIYWGITTESSSNQCYLEFKNDSILELSSIPKHMSSQFNTTFVYKKINNKIVVKNQKLDSAIIAKLTAYGYAHFLSYFELRIENNAILDSINRIVYVPKKDVKSINYTTYIIEGIEYKQLNDLSDNNVQLKRESNSNGSLRKKLKSIESQKEKYQIYFFKGIDAYLNYGYEKVMGVIVINRK
jgi:hypothetical protein